MLQLSSLLFTFNKYMVVVFFPFSQLSSCQSRIMQARLGFYDGFVVMGGMPQGMGKVVFLSRNPHTAHTHKPPQSLGFIVGGAE